MIYRSEIYVFQVYMCLEYLDILVYFIGIYICVPVCVIYILYIFVCICECVSRSDHVMLSKPSIVSSYYRARSKLSLASPPHTPSGLFTPKFSLSGHLPTPTLRLQHRNYSLACCEPCPFPLLSLCTSHSLHQLWLLPRQEPAFKVLFIHLE